MKEPRIMRWKIKKFLDKGLVQVLMPERDYKRVIRINRRFRGPEEIQHVPGHARESEEPLEPLLDDLAAAAWSHPHGIARTTRQGHALWCRVQRNAQNRMVTAWYVDEQPVKRENIRHVLPQHRRLWAGDNTWRPGRASVLYWTERRPAYVARAQELARAFPRWADRTVWTVLCDELGPIPYTLYITGVVKHGRLDRLRREAAARVEALEAEARQARRDADDAALALYHETLEPEPATGGADREGAPAGGAVAVAPQQLEGAAPQAHEPCQLSDLL